MGRTEMSTAMADYTSRDGRTVAMSSVKSPVISCARVRTASQALASGKASVHHGFGKDEDKAVPLSGRPSYHQALPSAFIWRSRSGKSDLSTGGCEEKYTGSSQTDPQDEWDKAQSEADDIFELTLAELSGLDEETSEDENDKEEDSYPHEALSAFGNLRLGGRSPLPCSPDAWTSWCEELDEDDIDGHQVANEAGRGLALQVGSPVSETLSQQRQQQQRPRVKTPPPLRKGSCVRLRYMQSLGLTTGTPAHVRDSDSDSDKSGSNSPSWAAPQPKDARRGLHRVKSAPLLAPELFETQTPPPQFRAVQPRRSLPMPVPGARRGGQSAWSFFAAAHKEQQQLQPVRARLWQEEDVEEDSFVPQGFY